MKVYSNGKTRFHPQYLLVAGLIAACASWGVVAGPSSASAARFNNVIPAARFNN